MSSRRALKAAEAVREVVSMAILTELKDPRVKNVTVTRVEMAADMRTAKVHVSIMGDETQERLTLRGLQNAAGFLQSRIKERIDTRYTPRLEFVLDPGVKQSIAIARILRQVLPSDATDTDDATDTEGEIDSDDEMDEPDDEELADEAVADPSAPAGTPPVVPGAAAQTTDDPARREST